MKPWIFFERPQQGDDGELADGSIECISCNATESISARAGEAEADAQHHAFMQRHTLCGDNAIRLRRRRREGEPDALRGDGAPA